MFKKPPKGSAMSPPETPHTKVALPRHEPRSYEQEFGLGGEAPSQRAQVLDLQSGEDVTEINPESVKQAFGTFRVPGGGFCVQFFQRSGDVTAIPYGHITAIRTHGRSLLSLRTSSGVLIFLEGKHLGPLRDQLSPRRAAFVKEGFRGPGSTEITSIDVQDTLLPSGQPGQ
jgi:hypothetical protein